MADQCTEADMTPDPILIPPAEVARALMRHIMIAYPQFDGLDIEVVVPAPGVLVRVADRGDGTKGDRG